jgi:5-methylcytosine-specific restriction endonuclease McrA
MPTKVKIAKYEKGLKAKASHAVERVKERARCKQVAMTVINKAIGYSMLEGMMFNKNGQVFRRERRRPKATLNHDKRCRTMPRQVWENNGINMSRPPIHSASDYRRMVLMDAQEGLCSVCGEAIDLADKWTLDHVIPIYEGGADQLGNLCVAHEACNVAKANDWPTGCEMVALFAVNARLDAEPVKWD